MLRCATFGVGDKSEGALRDLVRELADAASRIAARANHVARGGFAVGAAKLDIDHADDGVVETRDEVTGDGRLLVRVADARVVGEEDTSAGPSSRHAGLRQLARQFSFEPS